MKKLGVYFLVGLFALGLVGSVTCTSHAATGSLGGDDVSIRAAVSGPGDCVVPMGGQEREGDPYWDEYPF